MPLSEFSLIEQYFSHSDQGGAVLLGVGDDGAILQLSPGEQLVTSVDTLVSGVHFPQDADPADIARRAIRVNLSDLAAMGATPRWFTLALTIPGVKEEWLAPFSRALAEEAAEFGCALVGGDTTAGLLTISINIFGVVPEGQALLRSGAKVGDIIYVTGSLGDAAAALACTKGLFPKANIESEYLLYRFYQPTPRIAEGQKLRGVASAAIDISDGLLADLGHIARRSDIGAEISQDKLPLSDALKMLTDQQQVMEWALTGGDDYELCFTVPEKKADILEAMIALGKLDATAIGRMIEGEGVVCLDSNGEPLCFDQRGYQHF